MADFNQVVIDPVNSFVVQGLTVDNTTVLTVPKQYDKQSVTTMTVSDGGVLKVYNITNPASPVLIGTIG